MSALLIIASVATFASLTTSGPSSTPDLTGGAVRTTQTPSSTAHEVDRPTDFPWLASPPSCATETLLTDDLKQVATAVDEEARKGAELPWAEEQAIGDKMMGLFESELGGHVVTTGEIPTYLTAVAAPLLDNAARKETAYKFYLWEGTDVENAFALPGGYVILSKALYDSWLANEAQLAVVLGHEIGHVDLRHPIAVFEVMKTLGLPEEDAFGRALVALARMPYSSALEERTDRFGAEAMHEAGYSVFQAVSMWEKLAAKEEHADAARPSQKDDPLGALALRTLEELGNLVASHPASARRACLLKHVAHDLYQANPREVAYVGVSNLRDRIAMTTRVF